MALRLGIVGIQTFTWGKQRSAMRTKREFASAAQMTFNRDQKNKNVVVGTIQACDPSLPKKYLAIPNDVRTVAVLIHTDLWKEKWL